MLGSRLVAYLMLALVCSGCPGVLCVHATQQFSPDISYVFTVDQSNATRHIGHVALKLSPQGRFTVSLGFRPVILLDNGLEVLNFQAFDDRGRPLGTTFSFAEMKKMWTVQTQGVQELQVFYDVVMNLFFGQERVLDRAYAGFLCETFGVAMASWVFLVPEVPIEKIEAEFALPDGWTPVTPWQMERGIYKISSVDFFVSSVFAVGRFDQHSMAVAGTNVTIAVFSEWGQATKRSLTEYSFRAYETLTRVFGKSVQDSYLSIYTPRAPDGSDIGWLEWTQAQACTIDPQGNYVLEALEGILHRAFHNWNLWPPHGMSHKGNEEQWFKEGVNRYYDDDKIPIQLGIRRQHVDMRRRYDDYLKLIVGTRYDVPVAYAPELEFDYYARLVYHKGSLIGFLLDELIRSLTKDSSSLDLILATLYERYGTPRSARSYLAPPNNQRYSNDDILSEANRLTGKDLHRFFTLYIYGNSQLPFKSIGKDNLEVDWLRLSSELGLGNLTPTLPIKPQYVTVGQFRIDGSALDWTSYQPIIKDVEGDSKRATSGTDIGAVYAAADANYLHVMIQLWSKPDRGNDYIFPVDLNGDGQWDYSFGFNLDDVWMYDLRGVGRGQWPRERLSFLYLPHEIDEVAEIGIPLFVMDKWSSITIWAWVNNGGSTVDETASGTVPSLSTDKSITTQMTVRSTTTSVSSQLGPIKAGPTNETLLLLAGVIFASVAVIVYRLKKRKRSIT